MKYLFLALAVFTVTACAGDTYVEALNANPGRTTIGIKKPLQFAPGAKAGTINSLGLTGATDDGISFVGVNSVVLPAEGSAILWLEEGTEALKLSTSEGTITVGGGGGSWGSITGTLSNQTDLQSALNAKQTAHANLAALAGLTGSVAKLPRFTGAGAMDTISISGAGVSWIEAISAEEWLVMLGLQNVQNVALSTWAGSSNLTTLGTISAGTWQGSVIAPGYLGTGSSITTKFLRGDGTWQTLSGGGDALTSNPLSQFAATTSSQLRGVVSDETGTGGLVFANSPTLGAFTSSAAADGNTAEVINAGGGITISVENQSDDNDSTAIEVGVESIGIHAAVDGEGANIIIGPYGVTFNGAPVTIVDAIVENSVATTLTATDATVTGNLYAEVLSADSLNVAGSISGGTWAGAIIDSAKLDPAGSTGQIQYNSGGVLSAHSGLIYGAGSQTLQVGGTVTAPTVTATNLDATNLTVFAPTGFPTVLGYQYDGGTGSLTWPVTDDREIALPDASGTLLLANGNGSSLTGLTKSQVGLGSVENTALSTWAGTSNVTTLGTVTSGTWSASAIALAKGGTGATDASTARTNLGLAIGTDVQAYDGDLASLAGASSTGALYYRSAANTWSTVTVGSGLSFTSGTLSASGGGGGSGDVVGPSSVPDNQLVRFDGTSGKLIQSSYASINDDGDLTIAGAISTWSVRSDSSIYLNADYDDDPHGISINGDINVSPGTGGRISLGSSGANFRAILSATATLDFPSTSAGTPQDQTITVTGAFVGDAVMVSPPAVNTGCSFFGWVSSTNTVTIRMTNVSGSAQNPASGTFRATVIHF